MTEQPINHTFRIFSSVTVNMFYLTLLSVMIYDSRRTIYATNLIAPFIAFIIIQLFIILTHRRLPTLNELYGMVPSHILLFFQVSFVTMDVFGYFQPKKLQILLRISLLLLEYMMINNIYTIVQKGYLYQEYFTINLLVLNAQLIIYESIFLTIGSIVQFALYGDHIHSIYFIISITVLLIVVTVQFIYGFGLWKVIGNNINDL